MVRFSAGAEPEQLIRQDDHVTLHHVEIRLERRDTTYKYAVATGEHRSRDASFKAYPSEELRVAVVANWGYASPDLSAVRRDDPHLLLSAGDNIPNLHQLCGTGLTNCTKLFSRLIDSAPEIFRSTPFMPVLGNHDREIRERGPKPPPEAAYDIEATAFRTFFELPDPEWNWTLEVPEFDARFIALDLNHTSDFGTTWQTCHDFRRESQQFQWYRAVMETNRASFTITLQNEQNQRMRGYESGGWGKLFQMGSAVISGFGHYAERAEVNGFPYFNTALRAGDKYPDPQSRFLAGIGNYILITFRREKPMTVELKALDGRVLDRTICRRKVEG